MKTKQYTGYALALLLSVLALQVEGQSQSKTKVSKPDLENWTDEQLDLWEDSIKKALYPDPEIKQSSSAVDSVTGETVEIANASFSDQIMEPQATTLSVTIDQSKGAGV